MTFIEIFFTLILFFIILLIYVHIQNHYKTNDTMEILNTNMFQIYNYKTFAI